MKNLVLSPEEKLTFDNFIVKAVSSNITFPAIQMGARNITIQELIHQRTLTSLGEYADFLEKQAPQVTRIERMSGVKEKTISNSDISYKELINFIDLVIKMKQIEVEENKVQSELADIDRELTKLTSPTERKAQLLTRKEQILNSPSKIVVPETESK
jgi:hypothetical protein